MRMCTNCNNVKEDSEFNVYTRNQKTYVKYTCKLCEATLPNKYYAANKDTILKTKAEDRVKNPEKYLHIAAKSRAKRDGVPFDIAVEDIIIPEFCPVLGIRLKSNTKYGSKKDSPTLDKIIPELGYVKGNIQVISHLANSMKSYATPDELLAFARWVQSNFENDS